MQSSKKKKTGKAKTKEISLKLDINLSDDEQDAGRSQAGKGIVSPIAKMDSEVVKNSFISQILQKPDLNEDLKQQTISQMLMREESSVEVANVISHDQISQFNIQYTPTAELIVKQTEAISLQISAEKKTEIVLDQPVKFDDFQLQQAIFSITTNKTVKKKKTAGKLSSPKGINASVSVFMNQKSPEMFKTEEAVSQVSYPTFAIEESELRFDMAETIINQQLLGESYPIQQKEEHYQRPKEYQTAQYIFKENKEEALVDILQTTDKQYVFDYDQSTTKIPYSEDQYIFKYHMEQIQLKQDKQTSKYEQITDHIPKKTIQDKKTVLQQVVQQQKIIETKIEQKYTEKIDKLPVQMEDLEDFPEKLSLAPSIKKVTKKGKTKQKVNKIVPKLEIMEDFDEEKPPRVAQSYNDVRQSVRDEKDNQSKNVEKVLDKKDIISSKITLQVNSNIKTQVKQVNGDYIKLQNENIEVQPIRLTKEQSKDYKELGQQPTKQQKPQKSINSIPQKTELSSKASTSTSIPKMFQQLISMLKLHRNQELITMRQRISMIEQDIYARWLRKTAYTTDQSANQQVDEQVPPYEPIISQNIKLREQLDDWIE